MLKKVFIFLVILAALFGLLVVALFEIKRSDYVKQVVVEQVADRVTNDSCK
jgi:hypothetical protein